MEMQIANYTLTLYRDKDKVIGAKIESPDTDTVRITSKEQAQDLIQVLIQLIAMMSPRPLWMEGSNARNVVNISKI